MKPVRTAKSDLVYVGDPGAIDLHCQRLQPGIIRSIWHLNAAEREAIANGANIGLDLYQEPHPPVALFVIDQQGVGEDAPEIAARLAELGKKLI